MNRTIIAVLTGDIVNSRKVSGAELSQVLATMADLWQQFGKIHEGVVIGRLEVFRGDGWQVALSRPELAVKAAIFLRACTKAASNFKLDSRVGVGLGDAEHLSPDRLFESNGRAFHLAGAALDGISAKGPLWDLQATTELKSNCLSGMVLPIMDLSIRRWSRQEAVAVVGSLLGWTQETIAAHPLSAKNNGTQPTQQAVADCLNRIGWKSHWQPALKTYVTVFEIAQ